MDRCRTKYKHLFTTKNTYHGNFVDTRLTIDIRIITNRKKLEHTKWSNNYIVELRTNTHYILFKLKYNPGSTPPFQFFDH